MALRIALCCLLRRINGYHELTGRLPPRRQQGGIPMSKKLFDVPVTAALVAIVVSCGGSGNSDFKNGGGGNGGGGVNNGPLGGGFGTGSGGGGAGSGAAAGSGAGAGGPRGVIGGPPKTA